MDSEGNDSWHLLPSNGLGFFFFFFNLYVDNNVIFRSIIIDNFISSEEVKKISDRAVYKEDEEEWVVKSSRTQEDTSR